MDYSVRTLDCIHAEDIQQACLAKAKQELDLAGCITTEDSLSTAARSFLSSSTALDLFQAPGARFLSLGCPRMDAALKGGIPRVGITEITGESSSGKTQLLLQLLLQVQLPEEDGGLGGTGYFVSTEGEFPLRRYKQMGVHFASKHAQFRGLDLGQSVIVEAVMSVEQLVDTIMNRIQMLLESPAHNVRLVIIDSITAPFRAEYSLAETQERSRLLFKLAAQLKTLSHRHRVPMVIANQVTDIIRDDDYATAGLPGSRVQPALGLTWSTCVNSRLKLARVVNQSLLPAESALQEPSALALRQLQVVLSPVTANHICHFQVTESGLCDAPGAQAS